MTDPLRGACSCGRNHFIIAIPQNAFPKYQIMYDDATEHGRGLSLRVPLSRIHSTTYAYFPDETHQLIRRVFIPPHAPQTKRHFCGFCGTPLSYWTEERPEEADFVRVNVGSLRSESLDRLQDTDVFDIDVTSEDYDSSDASSTGKTLTKTLSQQRPTHSKQVQAREVRGNTWFEEMIEGSELGRIRRRRGGETSADGRTVYEWEVVDMGDDDADAATPPAQKRKLEDGGVDADDVQMRS